MLLSSILGPFHWDQRGASFISLNTVIKAITSPQIICDKKDGSAGLDYVITAIGLTNVVPLLLGKGTLERCIYVPISRCFSRRA